MNKINLGHLTKIGGSKQLDFKKKSSIEEGTA